MVSIASRCAFLRVPYVQKRISWHFLKSRTIDIPIIPKAIVKFKRIDSGKLDCLVLGFGIKVTL
jgi:hypothetical protein